jgi:hypothetical protein
MGPYSTVGVRRIKQRFWGVHVVHIYIHDMYIHVCSMYVHVHAHESPRAKTRHLGTKFFFDLDTPLKCGESSLSIPLCGKIR